jgi:protein phosphatase
MASTSPSVPSARVKDRYELHEVLGERPGVTRYRATDHQTGGPVVVVRGALPEMAEALLLEEDVQPVEVAEEDFMPGFDAPVPVAQVQAPAGSAATWPSVGWELALLEKARHAALPAVLDNFADGSFEYLVEELPQGRVLWDAWDDPDNDSAVKYGWLMQIAEGLNALHQGGAMIEGVRPDIITVTDAGQIMISDLTDLLPIPLPPGTPMRATLYTAPELILSPDQADARADLYSFGAMVYSLEYLHHTLEEKDFERQFSPRLITDRYPDVHPAFFRLICKTFTRDLNTRFPTDEASKTDKSGFTELINTLDVCRRNFDNCRLDIAAWTTTGMVRTGNEDAFGLMQAVESRQDELTEYAIVLLADGMGGYEAGEVAAAMCIASLRTYLLQQPVFSALAGKEAPEAGVFEPDSCKKIMEAALKHANKEVFTAARTPGKGRRGMGCTAEAVYVDSRNLVVGHVGDSRTYHMSNGRLKQLTRDQTFVNRMVELGQLTEEEAEEHPRKNELQQAIGGQPDVVPGVYSAKLQRGDWVLVCSDGLTNHVPTADLEKMLRETYGSSEETARRLMNLVNLRGATDNATLVVIRAI